MTLHERSETRGRVQRRLIWGLVVAVATIQTGTWVLADAAAPRPALLVQLVASWIVIIALAVLASRRIGRLTDSLTAREHAHRTTLDEVEQLQTQNAMLQIVTRSAAVRPAFQALAGRIARLVPCDRVGLALLTEQGEEFETSTARVEDSVPRGQSRPDVIFKVEGTAIGHVVRAGEPLLISDMRERVGDFLDLNVMHSSGFKSALIMPLMSEGRGVGTLNVVSRTASAFEPADIDRLRPIAEILAVAHVAQQLHMLVGKFRTIEAMAEVTLSIAAEINSALQTIVGHCELLRREYPAAALHTDLATIVIQAERIAALLDKMRTTTDERLKEVENTLGETAIATGADVNEVGDSSR